MKEIWKDIRWFEGLYAISNKGNVKSLRSGKTLKPYDNGGYKWAFYTEGVTTIESTSEKDGSE